jgi:hypothetical protein
MCDAYEIREIEIINHYDINGDDLCELCGSTMIYETNSGCQSSVGGAFWMIAIISSAAVMLSKKKEY